MKYDITKWYISLGIIFLIIEYVPFVKLALLDVGDNIYDGAHLIVYPLLLLLYVTVLMLGLILFVRIFKKTVIVSTFKKIFFALILLVCMQKLFFSVIGLIYLATLTR